MRSFCDILNNTEQPREFSVYKTDDEHRLVFGWASVSITVEGEQLEDRQQDMIDPEDLEEAAYEYVLNFRDAGEEHVPTMRKKGRLVESCVFTKEKQKAMGIPEGILPVGWWIGFKIEDDGAWQRVKDGTYQMFSIEGRASREPVEQIMPLAKTFEEICKFNPFHDARGRFASARGFKTYSANPKSKAGAMAIQRSNMAGHGRTLNVHAESKGESIQQNADWLATGKKPKVPAATSRARYQQRKQKQQQTTLNQKPKANLQADSKQLSQDLSNVTVTSSEKLAIKPRNRNGMIAEKVTRVADDNYQPRVQGKDISKTFDQNSIKGKKRAIDKVVEMQGWNKPATVTNDLELFQKAAIKSGRVMYRSVNGSGSESANQICQKILTDPSTSLGGNGGKVYGGGMYLTDCKITPGTTNARRLASNLRASSNESYYYGNKQMMATIHPDAKIATPTQANTMKKHFYFNMTREEQSKFGNDVGAYIASKGYDGAKWHADNSPTAYTTMYNKSAMIFYGGAVDAY